MATFSGKSGVSSTPQLSVTSFDPCLDAFKLLLLRKEALFVIDLDKEIVENVEEYPVSGPVVDDSM